MALGWSKIDTEKCVKQQDKDCIDIANIIINKIKIYKNGKSDEEQKK
jgi:hypothetical protein